MSETNHDAQNSAIPGDDAPTTEALESRIQALEAALELAEKAKAEVEQKAEDARLRAAAELENIRRRSQLDIDKAYKYSIEGLSRELLLVIDSLDNALAVASADDALKEGIQLTLKLLLDSLDKFGIHQINPLGETFNPAQHEAISMQPTDKAEEANQVLMVAQKGFTLKERILRPARVVVASLSPANAVQMAEADLGEKDNLDEDLV